MWNLRERKYSNQILTDDIEFHILEIPKIKDTEISKDELALWLKFIENSKNPEVKENMEKSENKYLKQAMEELGYLSSDPDFKRLIDARVGFLMDQQAFEDVGFENGKKEGKKEGLEEGKKLEKLNIAKKMLKENIPIEQIVKITGLTEEEIKKLNKK